MTSGAGAYNGAAYNEEQDSGCMSSDELHPATMTTMTSCTAGVDDPAAAAARDANTHSSSQAAEECNEAAATTRRLGRELWLHMLSCRCRPVSLCPDARCRAAKRLLHHRVTCQVGSRGREGGGGALPGRQAPAASPSDLPGRVATRPLPVPHQT